MSCQIMIDEVDGRYSANGDLVRSMQTVYKFVKEFASNHERRNQEKLLEFRIHVDELPINIGQSTIFEQLLNFTGTHAGFLALIFDKFVHLLKCLDIVDKKLSHARTEVLRLIQDISVELKRVQETDDSLEKTLDKLVETFVRDPQFMCYFDGPWRATKVLALRNYELSREIGVSLDDLYTFISSRL